MPCLTLPTDLSVGPVFPVRIRSEHGGKEAKTRAVLSTSCTDSLISPELVKRLGSVALGTTDLVLPHRVVEGVPFHVVTVRVTLGLLGYLPVTYRIKRVILLEADRDMGTGVVLGLNFIGQGALMITPEFTTFCL